jgi:DUF1680 family protein
MMKLSRMLYQQTADPRYFDYYERTLYNHRLGTVQKDGAMQYYLGIVPGAWRTFSTADQSFWCCDGTGVEEYSKLADSIYFHDATGIYVNLFIPSELKSPNFHLRQETLFPEQPRTRLLIESTAPLTIHLRIPAWVAGPVEAYVNGKPTDAIASPGSYLTIHRDWQKGDTIDLTLPMSIRYEPLPDDENLQAILYGPLVLAGSLGKLPSSPIGPEGPEMDKAPTVQIPELTSSLQPNGPLTFTANQVQFQPLHRTTDQRYSIYWRPRPTVNT